MPNVSANRLSAWGLKFDEQGNLDADRKPKSGTTITPNELAAVQDELTSGGRGQRKTTSLRKAQLTLASRGIKKGRETWRRALWQSGRRPKLSIALEKCVVSSAPRVYLKRRGETAGAGRLADCEISDN